MQTVIARIIGPHSVQKSFHDFETSSQAVGGGHDNAVAESFFQLLKRERIKRRIYVDHDEARADVFDYIEMFYNPKRRHGSAGGMSPIQFEQQFLSGS